MTKDPRLGPGKLYAQRDGNSEWVEICNVTGFSFTPSQATRENNGPLSPWSNASCTITIGRAALKIEWPCLTEYLPSKKAPEKISVP